MVHAWLVIEPRDGDGVGVQRMFSGVDYHQIEGNMKYALMKVGMSTGMFTLAVRPHNREGEVISSLTPGTDTGLLWKTMPCTEDGTNIDYGDPQEPSGE